MDRLVNKNPGDNSGYTPLHSAALTGCFNVCEFIMERLEDKNPPNNDGKTPLHLAAEKGHFNICKLFCKKIPIDIEDPL